MDDKELYLQTQSRFFDRFWDLRAKMMLEHLSIEEFSRADLDWNGTRWLNIVPFADDFLIGVRNEVELFGANVVRLCAWEEVLNESPRDHWPFLLEYAVLPIYHTTLLSPYMISERIKFCTLLLFEKADELLIPGHVIPDERKINNDKAWQNRLTAKPMGIDIADLDEAIKILKRSTVTHLRNRITHRIPPNLQYGFLTTVQIKRSGTKQAILFQGEPPALLSDFIPRLMNEHAHAVKAARAFCPIVIALIENLHAHSASAAVK
ncbi:MAG TPA: hypothetical protein VF092_07215 [Longimicrobium sp.]